MTAPVDRFHFNSDPFTAPARFWRELDEGRIQCELCPRGCILREGSRGLCKVRAVADGELKTLVYKRVASLAVDPIEKKPLFHFHPASRVLSLGTAGCNARCLFCQNWELSQARPELLPAESLTPADLVRLAQEQHCNGLAFTYSEPTIFAEYAIDAADAAHSAGLFTTAISNGLIEPVALRELYGRMDAVKVDLKAFSEGFYRKLVGLRLQPVLDTLIALKQLGKWIEVVTLLIPSLNDDEAELHAMCAWLREHLGADVPLHFSRFHPGYQLDQLDPTPPATLEAAHRIAHEEGLHYVYIGNLAGHAAQKTFCPHCDALLVDRSGFSAQLAALRHGVCAACGTTIAGVWQ